MFHVRVLAEYIMLLIILAGLYFALSFVIPIGVDDYMTGVAFLALYNSVIADRRAQEK
jgi:hypothetical protein